MALTHVGHDTTGSDATTTVTVNPTAAPAEDDVVVLALGWRGDGITATPPADGNTWNALVSDAIRTDPYSGEDLHLSVWYATMGATPPASFLLTVSANARKVGGCLVIRSDSGATIILSDDMGGDGVATSSSKATSASVGTGTRGSPDQYLAGIITFEEVPPGAETGDFTQDAISDSDGALNTNRNKLAVAHLITSGDAASKIFSFGSFGYNVAHIIAIAAFEESAVTNETRFAVDVGISAETSAAAYELRAGEQGVGTEQTLLNVPASVLVADDMLPDVAAGSWGNADIGGAWTLGEGAAADYRKFDGYGRMVVTGTNQSRNAELQSVSARDFDATVLVGGGGTLLDPLTISPNVQWGIEGRRLDNANYYIGKLIAHADGTIQVSVQRVLAGSFVNILAPTTVSRETWIDGSAFWMRVQMEDSSPTTIRVKVWRNGTSEPAGWDGTITDSSAALQGPGRFGLRGFTYLGGGSNREFHFSDLLTTTIAGIGAATRTAFDTGVGSDTSHLLVGENAHLRTDAGVGSEVATELETPPETAVGGDTIGTRATTSREQGTGVEAPHIPQAPLQAFIALDGQDVMDPVEIPSVVVRSLGYAGAGTAEIALFEPADEPTIGQEIEVLDGASTIFKGPVRVVRRRNIGSEHKKRYLLSAQDQTALLADDIVEDGVFIGGESDQERIATLIATWGTKGITASGGVAELVSAMPNQDLTGLNLFQAIGEIAKVSGAIFYADFTKDLHYFASESNPAPFNLSDAPDNVTTFIYGDLTLPDDTIDLCNAVFVIGAEGTTPAWRPDPSSWPTASQLAYGRRARTLRDKNLTTQEAMIAAGDAYVAANDHPRGATTLTVWQPGLRGGMVIQLTNATWGISAVPYRIAEVEVTIVPGTRRFQYRLTLGDAPINLGSLLGGQAGQIGTVGRAPGGVTLGQVIDLSVGGANLVKNSSFESGVTGSWDIGSSWLAQFASDEPFAGTKVARGTPVGGTLGHLITSAFINVDRLDDYWVSAWSRMLSRTSGTAQIFLREYTADDDFLAETVFGSIAAVQAAWTRYTLHMGPNSELGRTAWQASTARVKVGFRSAGAASFNWDVDGVQVERGKLLTAYAPAPSELADGAITETQIADDAITTPKLAANAVVAGKIAAHTITGEHIAALDLTAEQLILRDASGETALDASGFGPLWRRFITAGLYNSDFAGAPPFPGNAIDNVTNPLPFWALTEDPVPVALSVRSVTDPDAPSGRVIRFDLAASPSGAVEQYIEQVVAIPASRSGAALQHVLVSFREGPTSQPGTVSSVVRAVYVLADGTEVGTVGLTSETLDNNGAQLNETYTFRAYPNGGKPPPNAAKMKVQIGLSRASGSDVAILFVCDVAVISTTGNYRYVPLPVFEQVAFGTTTVNSTSPIVSPGAENAPSDGSVVGYQLAVIIKPTVANAGNDVRAQDYDDTSWPPARHGIVAYGQAAGLFNSATGFVKTGGVGNKNFRYGISRVAGDIEFSIRVMGYWTIA